LGKRNLFSSSNGLYWKWKFKETTGRGCPKIWMKNRKFSNRV
jgi:hypothetical protein